MSRMRSVWWGIAGVAITGWLLGAQALADTQGESGAHASREGPSAAYREATATMEHAMAMADSGDPDVDFATGMLAHHEGAVAMAQVELEYGTDPEMRALAEKIIAAQQAEIEQMRAWLEANASEEAAE
ncbi:CopM family metallochaperone [Salinicola avicenniae]|uniref:CopM family metallochaperone n=1 Tax=Salinicola avicenniae TaxID=2916836 RepID=UPI00207466AF|nr:MULTISPECIES: DUF305 domain-containing protein [unclassified Salinicola]